MKCDDLLLITYSVRADADAGEYEAWLRRVDNPFFNAARGFAHYSNWKVTGGTNHFAPHAYFDLVGMSGLDAFDDVWRGEEVNAFRREWRRLWGVEGANGAAAIQTWRCVRETAALAAWAPRLALIPGSGDADAGWHTWRVEETLRGSPPQFVTFRVRYDSHCRDIATDALRAECIAAPELA